MFALCKTQNSISDFFFFFFLGGESAFKLGKAIVDILDWGLIAIWAWFGGVARWELNYFVLLLGKGDGMFWKYAWNQRSSDGGAQVRGWIPYFRCLVSVRLLRIQAFFPLLDLFTPPEDWSVWGGFVFWSLHFSPHTPFGVSTQVASLRFLVSNYASWRSPVSTPLLKCSCLLVVGSMPHLSTLPSCIVSASLGVCMYTHPASLRSLLLPVLMSPFLLMPSTPLVFPHLLPGDCTLLGLSVSFLLRVTMEWILSEISPIQDSR